jgi:LysR family transcriptional regulator, nitrogen assimilation regulatory protein
MPPPALAASSLRRLGLRDLAVFEAVCDAGSLTVAACRLNLAQPSISRTIRGLEATVGMPLFRRTGRGVLPTPAGTALRGFAARLSADLDGLSAALAALRRPGDGEVRVLLPHHVSDVLVPPFVRAFGAAFPAATLHVLEEPAAAIPARLSAGAADLGLFYGSSVAAGLAAETVAAETLCLVGLASRLGRRATPIDLAQACAMPLIMSSHHTPFRRYVEARVAAAGHRLHVVRELEVSQSALAFVRDGEAAAILPFSHVHTELRRGGPLVARPIARPALGRTILLSFGKREPAPLAGPARAQLRAVIAAEGAALGWAAEP